MQPTSYMQQTARAAVRPPNEASTSLHEGDARLKGSRAAPVEVIIGTKAQYIKTAPVLRELSRRNIPYRLIDTGQHAGLAPGLRKSLGVQEPDHTLAQSGNIATIVEALVWALKITSDIVFRPNKIRKTVFSPNSKICLIHGDTPSTFLSFLLAKRAGKKIAHIEAGLRSNNIFKPFPEELIRIICMHFSDILFAPSKLAMDNLKNMRVTGAVVDIGHNTNLEAIKYALKDKVRPGPGERTGYAVFTIHRVETIFNKERLNFVLDYADRVSNFLPVKFIMHDPTSKRLKTTGLMDRLSNSQRIELSPLKPHSEFIDLIRQCEFVVTDGGSIQEESYFLNVPCLVMRTETERDEGVDANVQLSMFDEKIVEAFIHNHKTYSARDVQFDYAPSSIIADEVQKYIDRN